MDELRKPFLIAAIILAVLCIAVETGSSLWQPGEPEEGFTKLTNLSDNIEDEETRRMLEENANEGEPPRPGIGIVSLVALDALALFTMALVASPFLISHHVTGRVQGCATFLVAIVMLIGGFVALMSAISKTLLMAGLFVSAPFGTVAYLVNWGFFDTGTAAATLGLILLLKLGFAACLLLANQRFAKNKGLVLFLLTTLVATLLVQFLHGAVPGILASIADGVSAIVVLILALIWLIAMLLGSVVSIVKAIV